jgi:hypothetical protein
MVYTRGFSRKVQPAVRSRTNEVRVQVTKLPGTKYRESTTGEWIITPIKRMMRDVLCCQEVVGDSGSGVQARKVSQYEFLEP